MSAAASLFAAASHCHAAADIRIWTSRKGTTLEAELLKVDNVNATLVMKDAKQVVLKVEDLSLADRQYLVEHGNADASILVSGEIGEPEKQVRIDSATFKKIKGKTLTFSDSSKLVFDLMETEHFLIGVAGGVRPHGIAETAERLWHGMAFQHMNFRRDWDKRMLILLVEDRDAYTALGNWYVAHMKETRGDEEASKAYATWSQVGSTSIELPQDMQEKESLYSPAVVFNVQDESRFKKAMGPFQVHVLSGALLGKQLGGVSSYGAEGYFAVTKGHAYYKEISLAGKSETQLISVKGTDQDIFTSKKGFDDGTSWARTLRPIVRKGDIKTEIGPMFKWTIDDLTPERLVLIYSFSYYMQSTPQRQNSFAAMVRRIESSNQIPAPIEIARLFGFDTVEALEADWATFIKEGNFK